MEVISTAIFGLVLIWFFFIRRCGSGPKEYKIGKLDDFPQVKYERKLSKVPVARGNVLKALSTVVNSFIGNSLLCDLALKLNNMTFFRTKVMPEVPTFYPLINAGEDVAKMDTYPDEEEVTKCISTESEKSKFHGICDYTRAYKSGHTTPSEVVDAILASFVKAKSLNSIVYYDKELIKEMADMSTQRYLDNQTLSPIDGVPFVIKDEFPVAGYNYSCGTSFLGKTPEKRDCKVVERLRNLGGVIVGIANMHELGLGTTGGNSNKGFGLSRNPYDMEHYTGGSSSGCASAVAAGLCCASLGTDGGGSIRVPSSYCGVVGLKPTFGRVSLSGLRPVTFSVGHVGPITSSVKDAALLFSLLSCPDSQNPHASRQPPIKMPDFNQEISGTRIGIFTDYFKDCDEDIYSTCNEVVKKLEKNSGCIVKSVGIPELDEARYAHLIIILSEMTNGIQYEFDHNLDDLTVESRLLFTVGRKLTATDFIQASKQRTRHIQFFKKIFEEVDVLITPSTAQTAPKIHPADGVAGSLDSERDLKTMRYVYLGNLCGIPCISVPVGYDRRGLPIGLQIMGNWWREDIILKVAYQVEKLRSQLKLPLVYFDQLNKI